MDTLASSSGNIFFDVSSSSSSPSDMATPASSSGNIFFDVSSSSSSLSDTASSASSSSNIFFNESSSSSSSRSSFSSSSSSSMPNPRIPLKKIFRRPTPYLRRKAFAVRSKPASTFHFFGRSISSSSEEDQQYGGAAAAAKESVGSNTNPVPSRKSSTHIYIQIDDSSCDSEGSVNNY